MQQILERLIFVPEQKQDIKGLALIPAPTGFGKTYVTCDFIARNIERLIWVGLSAFFAI
jgi:ATP/maltotriose-dependent transcriptional regulator MalT